MSSEFYNKVYKACQSYFGNETKDFLDKQINTHLLKQPDSIEYEDRQELAKWLWVTSALTIGKEQARNLADGVLAIK